MGFLDNKPVKDITDADLKVIEDAAQAFGAKYNGKKVGSFSDVASFSFNVMKNVGGFGEAGAVTTNNKKIFELVKMLRYTGTKSDPKKIISNYNTKYFYR